MNISFLYRIGLVSMAVVTLSGISNADVFHLKDGRALEGEILSEGEESYLLEVLVARGIRDQITVAKEDVVRIERELPDEKEFAALQNLIPVPDLLSEQEYEQRINAIREFISTHPESARLGQAQEMLETHLRELTVVEVGGLKLDGKMITRDERLANRYYIDSRMAAAEIGRLAQGSGYLIALRAFKAFEAEYSGSESWHELLPFVRQLANAHKANAQEMLNGIDDRLVRQESGLSRMSPEERRASMRAIADRDAANKQRHDQERAMRNLWPTLVPDYRPTIDDTIRFADQEIRRLSAASTQPLRQPTPSQLWRNAVAAVQGGDETQIRTATQAARSARMPQRYLDQLNSLAGLDN